MTKWEYKEVEFSGGSLSYTLNADGEEGWELVAVTNPRVLGGLYRAFLKRPSKE